MNQLLEAWVNSRPGNSACPSEIPCGLRRIPVMPNPMAITTISGPILPMTSTSDFRPNQTLIPTASARPMPPRYFESP
ncbi:hypothetical protein [Arthrobacter sp. JCM 19049]|uniref:hypothetical protein n=1 Tax=Arthrobacter sp. JCM 19049 TaxID=1460643 RepID=UPI000AB6E78D|nr:hypothetical protein [Arthrobacter sp. JCM 19049]